MDDGFLAGIKHIRQSIDITPLIKVVTDAKGFQVLIAIKLLVVGVSDLGKFGLILCEQDWNCITAEIRPRHRDNMGARLIHQIIDQAPQAVITICGHMVKLIDGHNTVIEDGHW